MKKIDIRPADHSLFESTGLFCYTHRIKVLVLFAVLVALTLTTFKHLRMDVSIEGFLRKDDPVLTKYEQFRRDFGSDELIVVGIRGDDVFELNFLKKLKQLHDDLKAGVPYVDDITDLINIRHTRGERDTLVVEDLFENFPSSQQDAERLRQRAMTNALYKNLVISEDATTTSIVIRLLSFSPQSPQSQGDILSGFDAASAAPETGQSAHQRLSVAESGEAVEKAMAIVAKYDSKDFDVKVSGTAAVDHFLVNIIPKDTKKFLLLAYLTVIVLLGIVFRRVSGVLFPVIVVSLTLIFTLGLFALFKVPIKLPTQTMPSFLLAVSVCYSVHVLALFYYYTGQGHAKKEGLAITLSHSGKAIFLTGITTAVGLLSFSGSKNAPIGELGIFASSGVLISTVITFTLLPCLISFLPEAPPKKSVTSPTLLDRCLIHIATFATHRAKWILGVTLLILMISAIGFNRIEFSHNTLKWLPASAAIRQDTEYLDHAMKGTVSMDIIINTQKENGLYDPKLLAKIDNVSKRIENFSTDKVTTGKAWSLAEILKETHQALHGNNPDFYTTPTDKALSAQELFLFSNSGSDDLEDFTDSGFTKARISVKLPFTDAKAYHDYIKQVDTILKESFPNISVTSTGLIMIYAQVIANTMQDMKISYMIAILAITVLMTLLFGDIKVGLISMLPNLFPIIVIVGIAGFFNVPFSLFIMLIGNIVIGLAVDDTIHFMNNFTAHFKQGDSIRSSVEKTLLTSGRAMLLTTLILSCSFFIYLFSSLNHLNDFGILAGIAVILALIADFLIAPALMTMFYSRNQALLKNAHSTHAEI